MPAGAREQARTAPVARVLPMLGLAHLDRAFDYLIDSDADEKAVPGARVRVRFGGRRVDGFLLERVETSDHPGKLGWIERVVSPEPVLSPQLAALARAVAERYAGTMSDVVRLAIPPRHARTESRDSGEASPPPEAPDLRAWDKYPHAESYLAAVSAGGSPRAVWQAAPGEDWAQRLAEMATATAASGRGVIVVVPDQRDLDRLQAACVPLLGDRCVTLAAGLGPSARYRRWLDVRRGRSNVVLGTRSAIFAPVTDLGLVIVFDDGDDSLDEPRAPYPHPREVGVLRSHQERCAFMIGGFARTAEAQALVESGWAHDLLADRTVVRAHSPRIYGLSDEDNRVARDPLARASRIPAVAFDAARRAIAAEAPVLFSVPRRGYIPSVACDRCRAHARCRACHGPLSMDADGTLGCRWCGRIHRTFRCTECGGTSARALTTGAGRTAEELGRAFAGVPIVTSGGATVVDEIEPGARVVVSTPGAEPHVEGGYGAAIVLDTWAFLDRADLRAAETAVRRWMAIGTQVRPYRAQDGMPGGGEMMIVADSTIRAVQALIRWHPVGFAVSELREREQLGFPPAVTMAAVDGAGRDISAFLDRLVLPEGADVLGPVPLPPGVRPPAGTADNAIGSDEVERVLVRVDRRQGRDLAHALTEAQVHRNTHHDTGPIRVQVDPPTIG